MTSESGAMLWLGAVGISGQLFGMPFELLLIGGIVGAAMLGKHKATTHLNGISIIFFSAVLAASIAPHLPGAINHLTGWKLAQELEVFASIAIAAAWPHLTPYVFELLKSLILGFKWGKKS